jgi:hypothetical protein
LWRFDIEKTAVREAENELTKSEEWFRDKLNDYIEYGLGAFVVFAGWLISSDSIISLEARADADKKEAAIMLALLLPVLWVIWYVILLGTHSRCPLHSTVVKRKSLHLYAVGLGIALFILWFMVADVYLMAR